MHRSHLLFENHPDNCKTSTKIIYTAQKMKFSIKDFFSKCDQIRRKLRIWSHLLKKFLMENFTFFAVVETGTELKTGRNKESLANK